MCASLIVPERCIGEPLRTGDTISVTLSFTRAGEVGFQAPVLTYTEVVELLERRPES